MFLDYFALFMVLFVAVFVFYAIIVIHDIPYEISKERNHPHQDAIHVAGWVSLFTLHVLWPFLWIWSTLYREDRGWGFSSSNNVAEAKDSGDSVINLEKSLAELTKKVELLENKINDKAEAGE